MSNRIKTAANLITLFLIDHVRKDCDIVLSVGCQILDNECNTLFTAILGRFDDDLGDYLESKIEWQLTAEQVLTWTINQEKFKSEYRLTE